jgi:hypothetical protein
MVLSWSLLSLCASLFANRKGRHTGLSRRDGLRKYGQPICPITHVF